jgi:predicted phosphodiesterase
MIDTLMVHSISGNTRYNAARYSHNSIQGHHHSVFEISYYADMHQLRWAMSVGCLLDPNSAAARYAKRNVLKRPILGCGVVLNDTKNILVISDMHLPYQHRDAMDFLFHTKRKYKCTEILNVGDVIDHHRGSYHESEPDSMDAETEYLKAKADCKKLQDIFPSMIITKGNHDIIPERKLKTAGLPSSMLQDYNKLYELKDSWVWKEEHKFDSLGGIPMLVPMVLNKHGRWVK